MKTIITTIVLVFILISIGVAQVIRVPADMGVIQDALNACLPGDTVIVSPGTYYENLIWPNTQSICLISEMGPASTIIDGGSISSVVTIDTGVDTSTNIKGFTIRNGSNSDGGGIYCNYSSPSLENLIVSENTAVNGGGILFNAYSYPILRNSTISNNIATTGGGGICCWESGPRLETVTIDGNTSEYGGGIHCYSSSITLINVTDSGNTANFVSGILCQNYSNLTVLNSRVIHNTSTGQVGGICCYANTSLYLNNVTIGWNTTSSGGGGGIEIFGESIANIINCTIIENTAEYRGGGLNAFNSNLQIEASSFINNEALNGDGGGISAGNCNLQIDDCSFTENEAPNGGGGAISYVADTSSSSLPYQVELTNNQLLDNIATNRSGGVMIELFDADPSQLNVVVDNCEFVNNDADNYSGLSIRNCFFTVSNSVFTGNTAVSYAAGGGFSRGSIGTVSNCLFASNIANTGGGGWNSGGVGVWSGANVDFMNCTFGDNSAFCGAGLTVGGGGTATTTNCIFWGNSTDQIALDTYNNLGGTITVNYCDIQGGENFINIVDPSLSILNWGDENIDADPFFVDPGNGEYDLQNASPCIGAAIDSMMINGMMCYCPPTDIEGIDRPFPEGSMPDIGAYESLLANPVSVEENEMIIPTEYALYQNYPNPFNPSTTISYSVAELNFVTLKVYDVLGSEITTLINEEKPAGSYDVEFNASQYPSGIYFYRLQAGSFVETKKMVLMK